MYKPQTWSSDPQNKATIMRKALSFLSLRVRSRQFDIFWREFKPKKTDKVLDVGVSPEEGQLADTNFFIKKYPYRKNLTAVSVENCSMLFKAKYPRVRFIQIEPGKKLPFKDKSFEIVVSWATLEHVGNRKKQKFFINELLRVGKKAFITTPNRYGPYEPHSGLWFVHWLPHRYFSFFCRLFGKIFWADVSNLNPLGKQDLYKLLSSKSKVRIESIALVPFWPTHLMVIKK